MATALTSPLPSIHPILDPLIVSLADPGDPASGRTGQSQCEVQIEVEDVLNSDSWRLIGELLNPYDYTTDTAQAVLHKNLQGAFQSDPTAILSTTLTELSGVMKRYRIKARDVVDGTPLGSFATLGPALAWNAGHQYVKQGLDNVGSLAYRWLSIRPILRRIHPQEPISLQFAVFGVNTEVTLVQNLAYTDGTSETINVSLGALVPGKAYAIRLGNPESGFAKPLKYYECGLTGIVGTGEFIRFVTITKPTPWYRLLYFKNSWGGYESIAMIGKSEELNIPTGELFEAQEYPSANGQLGNSRSFNQRATDSLILRTGYMSAAEKRSLRDLTLRNEVWILEGTALRKLILSNAQWSVKADDQYLHALELTARYAWDEIAYSR